MRMEGGQVIDPNGCIAPSLHLTASQERVLMQVQDQRLFRNKK